MDSNGLISTYILKSETIDNCRIQTDKVSNLLFAAGILLGFEFHSILSKEQIFVSVKLEFLNLKTR